VHRDGAGVSMIVDINPAKKYLKIVIPGLTRNPEKNWMPDRVRHDMADI
jgi:hypothetical protein